MCHVRRGEMAMNVPLVSRSAADSPEPPRPRSTPRRIRRTLADARTGCSGLAAIQPALIGSGLATLKRVTRSLARNPASPSRSPLRVTHSTHELHALGSIGDQLLVGPARRGDAAAQLSQLLIRNVDVEGADLVGGLDSAAHDDLPSRRDLNAALTSVVNRSGSCQAAKWLPWSTWWK